MAFGFFANLARDGPENARAFGLAFFLVYQNSGVFINLKLVALSALVNT